VAAFAEDAVLHSPFTDALAFVGREQLDALVGVMLEVLEDLVYTDEWRREGAAVLVGCARVGGLELQFTDHLTLDRAGLVEEMTVYFRPLPASTAALRRFGAGLGRRRGAARGRLIGSLSAPLALMARAGDRVGARLVKL
jgi:hypothetical protein